MKSLQDNLPSGFYQNNWVYCRNYAKTNDCAALFWNSVLGKGLKKNDQKRSPTSYPNVTFRLNIGSVVPVFLVYYNCYKAR